MERMGRSPVAAAAIVAAVLASALAVGGCKSDKEYSLNDLLKPLMPKSPETVMKESVLSPSADTRRVALYEMSKWKTHQPETVELIGLTLIGDADPMVRAQAARTLGAWKDPAGAPYLIKALTGDTTTLPAIGAEGEAKPAPSGPAIPDTNKFVRTESAAALAGMETEPSTAQLVQALRFDPDVDVRASAAQALKSHRSVVGARGLAAALADRNVAVSATAHDSLCYVTGVDFGLDVKLWSEFFDAAEDPLADYGRMPKATRKADVEQIDPNAGKKAKVREILSDLFPLERKEGPFD